MKLLNDIIPSQKGHMELAHKNIDLWDKLFSVSTHNINLSLIKRIVIRIRANDKLRK